MKTRLIAISLFVCAAPFPAWAKSLHYTFILPNNYVGWVQVIFNDPQASPLRLRRDKGFEIEVQESGIARTSHLRVHDFKRQDDFYYRLSRTTGTPELRKVPSDYVLPGDSHGGFGVTDTGGKGLGYSWFIFVGPPELRATVPLADWDKVADEWSKTHGGNKRVEFHDQYPTPGRMPPKQP